MLGFVRWVLFEVKGIQTEVRAGSFAAVMAVVASYVEETHLAEWLIDDGGKRFD